MAVSDPIPSAQRWLLDQCCIGFKNFVITLNLKFNSSARLALGYHQQQRPCVYDFNTIDAEQYVTSPDTRAPGRAVGGHITDLDAAPYRTAIGLQ